MKRTKLDDRVRIENGWVLGLYPRSGLGFKYRLQLNNTVGIIDSDYYNSDNEGLMFVKLTNDSNEDKSLSLKAGQGMVQGISMILLYTMSAIYHGLSPKLKAKKVFQIMDHCSIFVLIAGTYTPTHHQITNH